jgi:predicted small lipoprotein YifL
MKPRAAWVLMVAVLLAACGQKGDLYFPDQEREAVLTIPAQDVPAPQDTADDDDPAAQGTPATPPAGTAGQ